MLLAADAPPQTRLAGLVLVTSTTGCVESVNQGYGYNGGDYGYNGGYGNGYSATAFLWPVHMGNPEWAEIDFAEILSGNRRSGGLFIHHGKDDQQVQRTTRADFTQWHTVAVDWLPDHVTFWMDGKKTWTYKGAFVPKQSLMQLYLRNEMRAGFHRMASTPQKITMQVDWIRVYRAPAPAQ